MVTSPAIEIPPYALHALSLLEDAGYEAWCVGGCVRDALLGRQTNDYDIATSAPWESTELVLQKGGFTVHRTGIKHGTVTASVPEGALEITTFRSDGAYSDGRHPDSVAFTSSIEEDLARRDFTINALAYHPDRGLLDACGGLKDLEAGIICVVGDPGKRFSEDGLRILRGCRFASQLGLSFDSATLQAMKSHKMMLSRVSAERITHELDGLLLGSHVHDALMATADVLVAVMPEIAACRGFDQHTPYHCYDVWEHIAWVVQRTAATRLNRWAALFHDIGKPSACFFEGERAHFYGHAQLSVTLAANIMGRLSMSPSFVKDVLTLVRIHDDQIAATPRSVKKALAKLDGNVELFGALIDLKRADALSQSQLGAPRAKLADDLARVLASVLEDEEAFTLKQLAIDGRDALASGIAAGPEVGAALNAALDAVIDGNVANERDALLAFLAERGPQRRSCRAGGAQGETRRTSPGRGTEDSSAPLRSE